MDALVSDLKRSIAVAAAVVCALPAGVWLASRLLKRFLERLFPPKSFNAAVIGKRLEVKEKEKKPHTSYYITVQPEDGGDRAEYKTSAADYALLAPGDSGVLTLHLGKFVSFKRF